jgi:hypothetical protein
MIEILLNTLTLVILHYNTFNGMPKLCSPCYVTFNPIIYLIFSVSLLATILIDTMATETAKIKDLEIIIVVQNTKSYRRLI